MVTFISRSPAETEALGESWGRVAQKGWVIGLSGELGAGKTQLVRGLARGLGSPQRVHSPTFTLVNVYTGGRFTLFHIDLYRLETSDQIIAAGIEDYFNPAGVAVIEWAERWFETRNPKSDGRNPQTKVQSPKSKVQTWLRWVQMETVSETERRIDYEDLGT
jgi:tRNA threonylcarbamoyladenosine biosynthesis protein TsaE